jgi:hypothetical protein
VLLYPIFQARAVLALSEVRRGGRSAELRQHLVELHIEGEKAGVRALVGLFEQALGEFG